VAVLGPVSAAQVHAAQIITGATMAAWLACGAVPGLRRHAGPVRLAILGAYLLAAIGYTALVLLR
jgi:hypothetical protein